MVAQDERILAAAERIFAEDGFDAQLSRIARAAGVPSAALARLGGRKGLVERVIERLFRGRWKPEWDELLADRSIPLEPRLVRFFCEYRGNVTRTGARLWTRTGLLGRQSKGNFSATLEKRIHKPIARELRHEAGVRSTAPVSRREIELVHLLHGGIAFPHTRSHVFGMAVYGRLPELIAMMVRVWLPGARAEIRRLHKSKRGH
jgi:AcrR family transcriptional regulator